MSASRPVLLVVAGRDPTGDAGVDADREAAQAFGAEALCVVTAETDQDGRRVRAIGARAPALWLEEARTALAGLDPGPDAIKTGLLAGRGHVEALSSLLDELRGKGWTGPVVVDPVAAASSGEPFLDAGGIAAVVSELVPRGVILTPNLPEAALLIGRAPGALAAEDARLEAARRLVDGGARAVLLKGGHDDADPVRDLVLEAGGEPLWLEHPRVRGASLRGSGCRFATAVAARLAAGTELSVAAADAGAWVARLIAARLRPLPSQGGSDTLSAPPRERL